MVERIVAPKSADRCKLCPEPAKVRLVRAETEYWVCMGCFHRVDGIRDQGEECDFCERLAELRIAAPPEQHARVFPFVDCKMCAKCFDQTYGIPLPSADQILEWLGGTACGWRFQSDKWQPAEFKAPTIEPILLWEGWFKGIAKNWRGNGDPNSEYVRHVRWCDLSACSSCHQLFTVYRKRVGEQCGDCAHGVERPKEMPEPHLRTWPSHSSTPHWED